MIYLGKSLFVKLYLPEAGSRELEDSIGDDPQIVLSDLIRVEFASAIARPVREGSLTSSRGRALLRKLDQDWAAYTRVVVEDAVPDLAQVLLARHAIRTLDAIHLASALIVDRRVPGKLRFGTADRRQAEAAAAESLASL